MKWYEVWSDVSPGYPYILILSAKEDGRFVVSDPKEGNKVVYSSNEYEEAKLWLLEDEFTLVSGRMTELEHNL
ncbi:MAG: hypothetical protein AAFW66_14645 [Pseudomonadota bacterium]